jgi:hypothetical protein
MIFRSFCCNPKTTFTPGSLESYTNLPENTFSLAMQSPAGLDLAGGGIGGRGWSGELLGMGLGLPLTDSWR